MILTDRPFLDRLDAARDAGFDTVEFWGWRDKAWREIAARAASLGMRLGAFSGNRHYGLLIPSERQQLLSEIRESLDVAGQLGCKHMMLLACPLHSDGSADPLPLGVSQEEAGRRAVEALRALAPDAERAGVCLVLEPLNTRVDHPGYFPDHSQHAFEWIRSVDSPFLRVLYDVYHMFIMGEDVVRCMEENLPWIGYIHFADVPGRHEPGSGSVPYTKICSMLRRRGYDGLVGLEFSPSGEDVAAARAALTYFD